jgi:hypothetical protein
LIMPLFYKVLTRAEDFISGLVARGEYKLIP